MSVVKLSSNPFSNREIHISILTIPLNNLNLLQQIVVEGKLSQVRDVWREKPHHSSSGFRVFLQLFFKGQSVLVHEDIYRCIFVFVFLCLQVCFLIHFLYKFVCPPENVGVGTAVRRLLERSSSTKLVRPVIGLSLLTYLFKFLFSIFKSSTYLSIFFYPAFILVNNV